MAREVVLTVDVEVDPEAVTDALTTEAGLTGFWTPDVSAEPRVGADLRFGFEAAPVDLDMTLEVLEPGERVEWSCQGPWPWWGGTRVTWRLVTAEAGTRVVLVHGGWADDYPDDEFGTVGYTWGVVLRALKSYVETGERAPALP